MTPQELPAYLLALRDRIASQAAVDAANAMALRYHEHLTDVTLRLFSHPRFTRTPSPPGRPPALVTGTLRRSVRVEPAVPQGPGRAMSSVAPHTVYARIQEVGGDVHVVRARVLTDGRSFFGKHVRIPARPYMRPARDDVIADGTLRQAAIDAVARVVP